MSNEASAVGHDDLVPEQTEGFKVGEKKTIDEYQKLGKSTGGNMLPTRYTRDCHADGAAV